VGTFQDEFWRVYRALYLARESASVHFRAQKSLPRRDEEYFAGSISQKAQAPNKSFRPVLSHDHDLHCTARAAYFTGPSSIRAHHSSGSNENPYHNTSIHKNDTMAPKTNNLHEAEQPAIELQLDEHKQMKSPLAQRLRRAIKKGAPLYNKGQIEQCLQVYMKAAQDSLDESKELAQSAHGQLLQGALDKAAAVLQQANPSKAKAADKGAWILRLCFDVILEAEDKNDKENKNKVTVASSALTADPPSTQDKATQNTTVDEKEQEEPTQNTTADEYEQTPADHTEPKHDGEGVVVKDTLRDWAAAEQPTQPEPAREAGVVQDVFEEVSAPDGNNGNEDGNHFSTDTELEQSPVAAVAAPQPHSGYNAYDDDEEPAQVLPESVSVSEQDDHSSSHQSIPQTPVYQKGVKLVKLLSTVEPMLEIQNRK